MLYHRRKKSILVAAAALAILASPLTGLAQRGEDNPDGPFKTRPESGHAGCAEYRLSAFGGDAGFRLMNNPGKFRRISNGSVRGKICDGGRVRVELSKRHPNTHVSLDIAGREYTFGQGERGDKLDNNWFRRYFTIDLPQHSGGYGHGNHFNHYGHRNGRLRGTGHGGEFSDWNDYGGGYGAYDHPHQYGSLPGLRMGSNKHRRAHRRGIPHKHSDHHLAWH